MKALIFAAALLIAGTASAATDSVKICNPANKAESLSVSVNGENATIVSVGADKVEKSTAHKVTETSAVSAEDLAALSQGLQKTLTEGQVYVLDNQIMLVITKDNAEVKYLIQALEEGLSLLGDSASCN